MIGYTNSNSGLSNKYAAASMMRDNLNWCDTSQTVFVLHRREPNQAILVLFESSRQSLPESAFG